MYFILFPFLKCLNPHKIITCETHLYPQIRPKFFLGLRSSLFENHGKLRIQINQYFFYVKIDAQDIDFSVGLEIHFWGSSEIPSTVFQKSDLGLNLFSIIPSNLMGSPHGEDNGQLTPTNPSNSLRRS